MLALSIPVWTQRCGKDNSQLPYRECEQSQCVELHVAFLRASCYTSKTRGTLWLRGFCYLSFPQKEVADRTDSGLHFVPLSTQSEA